MKYILFILPCLLLSISNSSMLSAQSSSPDLVIGVITQPLVDYPQNEELRQSLNNKIVSGLTVNGISATSGTDLNILVRLNRGETFMAETVPPRQLTTFYLELQLENTQTGEVFSTYSKSVKATGRNQLDVIKAAINQLSLRDKQFQDFTTTAKAKINEYYNSNCESLVLAAKREISQRNYLTAIDQLSGIPPQSSCAPQVQDLIDSAFSKYEVFACSANLAKADALIANQNYEGAMVALLSIPNPNYCAESYLLVANQLSSKKEMFQAQLWDQFIQAKKLEVDNLRHRENFLLTLAYMSSQNQRYQIQNNTIVLIH